MFFFFFCVFSRLLFDGCDSALFLQAKVFLLGF